MGPADRRRIVAATTGLDPARNFVGGPAGNLTNTGLIVPSIPTVDQYHRYLGRLASFFVPARTRAIITGIRQLLTIAARVDPEPSALPQMAKKDDPEEDQGIVLKARDDDPEDPCNIVPMIHLEREVRSPLWSFPDGNVVWFLRACQVMGGLENIPAAYQQGWSSNMYGLEPAWLYSNTPGTAPYVPPNSACPIGTPLGSCGTMYGLEFPYRSGNSNEFELNIQAEGPSIVSMFVSIWQPDTTVRLIPNLGSLSTSESGLEQEDLFWINFPCAKYYRVGAELTARLEPISRSRKHPKCPASDPQTSCPTHNADPARAQASCMIDDEAVT